jgi:hypothetical protein
MKHLRDTDIKISPDLSSRNRLSHWNEPWRSIDANPFELTFWELDIIRRKYHRLISEVKEMMKKHGTI